MISRYKIGIVIVYYGNWPEWTPCFLKSCSVNTDIQWLIFSDRPPAGTMPDNVNYFEHSLQSFGNRVKKVLGISPNIIHPYKLTDLKPAYGLIFQDYLTGYSHWGYSDSDLVYGSIDHFINDDILAGFDIISPSPDFFPGHFMLFKNTELTINLFKSASNWQEVFLSEKYYCFDENLLSRGIDPDNEKIFNQIKNKTRRHVLEYKVLRNPVSRRIKKTIPVNPGKPKPGKPTDFNSIIRLKTNSGKLKASGKLLFRDDVINLIEGKREINVKWKNGELFDDDKEIMYYHFQLAKYEDSFKISSDTERSFAISAQLKI